MAKPKKVLIIIHNGVEDVEFTTPHDVMIRMGIDPEVMFLNDEEHLRTSYGLLLKNPNNREILMRELDKFDALFIPGGPGNENVDNSKELDQILEHFVNSNKVIGSICAAPTLLAKRGYLKDKEAICFDDKVLRKIMTDNGAKISNPSCQWGEPCEVVEDGQFMTGLMYKSALPFAIKFADKVKKW